MTKRRVNLQAQSLEASFRAIYVPVIPPHLAAQNWLDFEYKTILQVYNNLRQQLDKLSSKVTTSNVHDARVALRRWFSIWEIVLRDNWQSKKLAKKCKKLRRLLKILGEARDTDVAIELGKKLGVPKATIKNWKANQPKHRRDIKRYIKSIDVEYLLDKLEQQLTHQYEDLSRSLKGYETAYKHLEPYLLELETVTKKLEAKAKTAEELHELRLSVKDWRYFLDEFFGLTSLGLYKTQQTLGKLNDINRLTELVGKNKDKKVKKALEEMGQTIFKEFANSRKELPYGLRPSISGKIHI